MISDHYSGLYENKTERQALKEAVDLFVNTFERTYTRVLSKGFFPSIEEQNQYRFSKKIALINNVQSRKDASIRADILIERGEIDAYYFVADYLDQALEKTGSNYPSLFLFKPFLQKKGISFL
jgi:hypothetical protein